MSNQEVAIKVEGVSKDFVLPHLRANSVKSLFTGFYKPRQKAEKQHALKNISFEIKKGEFFGIVGRNGSGKSTMLKMLAGIYQPTSGKISVEGKLVPFIELGVGFNPELTGRENVYLSGALSGFSTSQMDEMYDDIVSFAELEEFMDKKLKNYSSGMQVRLAFSVATRAKADILLIDEVLAVGDADFQRKCFEYFKDLKKNNKTVVFVSHDMSAVQEYCDRVILLEKSELIHEGIAADIAKEYSQLFLPKNQNTNSKDEAGKWGTGDIDIDSITLTKNVVTLEDSFVEIVVEMTAKKYIPEPYVCGITIKNESGHPVCGTNSKITKVIASKMKAGQKSVITWRVPNIFNEGKYTVEPAVVDGATMETYQWWDNAASFISINDEKTPYVVAPKIDLRIETV